MGAGSQNKPSLRFGADGVFRILMMSDIQESASYDPRSLASVKALISQARPDLVLLGGDNCYGPEITSPDDLRRFLDIFTRPMESAGIPWAHVFGNHDHDAACDISLQQEMYESFPMCVSGHTGDGVHGKSNFLLPVYSSDGSETVFAVWGLDTNNTCDGMDGLVPGGDMRAETALPANPLGGGQWDCVRFDQLMWYWNTSLALEARCGRKIPGLLCMHIAPAEFITAARNPERCVLRGSTVEPADASALNSGLFAALLQRGDIKTVACGHTHKNDMEAVYCGLNLCWDACTGYRCYGIDGLRGGRVFEVRRSSPEKISTRMIHTLELI